MKKAIISWIAIILVFGLASGARAEMTALAENELATVTGNGGIAITAADTLGLNLKMDTLYYHDDDGVAPAAEGGYLSLCGINMKGSVAFGSPLTIDVATESPFADGTQIRALAITIDDVTLKIDSFSIDAIRVGDAPGEGPSFGGIGIKNLVMNVSGKIRIYAH